MSPSGKYQPKTYLKNGVDFFFDRERIYLTVSGQEKISMLSLSGSKLKYFFTEETSFAAWMKMFGMEEWVGGASWDTTDKEEYFLLEQKVRDYIREQLGLDFTGYGFWERNFFSDLTRKRKQMDESPEAGLDAILGGVPDGVLWDPKSDTNILAILEIKTTNIYKKNWKEENWTSYLVQTLLYMYLSETNTGYICVLRVHSDEDSKVSEKEVILNSPLTQVSEGVQEYFNESSAALNNETFSFDYTVDEYRNISKEDTELYLYKIQLEIKKIDPMIQSMTKWWKKHSQQSPEMSYEEFLKITQHKACI